MMVGSRFGPWVSMIDVVRYDSQEPRTKAGFVIIVLWYTITVGKY